MAWLARCKEDRSASADARSVRRQDAAELKAAGNACFGKGEHAEALAKYEAALAICPTVSVCAADRLILHSNCAEVLLRMGRAREAALAASAALALKDTHAKSADRRITLTPITLTPNPNPNHPNHPNA